MIYIHLVLCRIMRSIIVSSYILGSTRHFTKLRNARAPTPPKQIIKILVKRNYVTTLCSTIILPNTFSLSLSLTHTLLSLISVPSYIKNYHFSSSQRNPFPKAYLYTYLPTYLPTLPYPTLTLPLRLDYPSIKLFSFLSRFSFLGEELSVLG